jgi:hypothetical protein
MQIGAIEGGGSHGPDQVTSERAFGDDVPQQWTLAGAKQSLVRAQQRLVGA